MSAHAGFGKCKACGVALRYSYLNPGLCQTHKVDFGRYYSAAFGVAPTVMRTGWNDNNPCMSVYDDFTGPREQAVLDAWLEQRVAS